MEAWIRIIQMVNDNNSQLLFEFNYLAIDSYQCHVELNQLPGLKEQYGGHGNEKISFRI